MDKNIKHLSLIEAKDKLKELRDVISYHNKQYYQKDMPVISDHEYDEIFNDCRTLENQFPELYDENSPTNEIGFKGLNIFSKITHTKPMLSLNNIFDVEGLKEFYNRILKDLNIDEVEILCELKIDGVSFTAKYIDGSLLYGATRGNGKIGEDVTENIKNIKDLPENILYLNIGEILEVRGEIYIDNNNFNQINEKRKENKEILFANPRNAAAGSLRQLNSETTKSRGLKYFLHGYGEISRSIENKQSEIMCKLESYGFRINKHSVITNSLDEIDKFYHHVAKMRKELDYEIDGIVCKVNNIEYQNRLGSISRSPRWAVAYKFPATLEKTTVQDIIIQVGRMGSLTPVAILKPVNIAGVIVSRASLHNRNELEKKDVRIGDTVVIQRSGDVIPQIVNVDMSMRISNSKKFIYPNICPSCNSKAIIEKNEAVIRCTNSQCPAQNIGQLSHFVSRDAMNISGLGEKQIKFLVENHYIKNQIDIFTLEKNNEIYDNKLQNHNGFGNKSIYNLFQSINNAKSIELHRFIYALGIKFVGINTSKLIAEYYKNIDKFIFSMKRSATAHNELLSINGIGNQTINSLNEYFNNVENVELIENLSEILSIQNHISNNSYHILSGKIIVFTGKLISISRREAKMQAENSGAIISSSISKKVDYLVAGEASGSKIKKATDLGINIIYEQEWLDLIKE